jgi:hypothetical protein
MQDINAPPARDPGQKIWFADVLRAEMQVIVGKDLGPFDPGPAGPEEKMALFQEVQARRAVDHCGTTLSALCLSGGGIRSATFALGVLQGLARFRLLNQFHYLSSVSGGGYIASWLSQWRNLAADEVIREQLEASLSGGVETPQIVAIRKDSNYLTPVLGLFSADTWTLVTLYIRNLLLNWCMWVPFFLGVLAFPRVCASGMGWISRQPVELTFNYARWLGCLSILTGLTVGVYGRFRKQGQWLTNPRFLLLALTPLVLSAAFFALAAVVCGANKLDYQKDSAWYWTGVTCGAVVYFVAWLIGRMASRSATAESEKPIEKLDVFFWTLSGALVGYLIAIGMALVADSFAAAIDKPIWLATTLGLSWSVVAYLTGELVYVGLSSKSRKGDMDREWLARSSGWLTAVAVSWALYSCISLYAPAVLRSLLQSAGSQITAAFALGVPGLVAVLLGKSSRTAATRVVRSVKGLSLSHIASAAAVIFALLGASLLSLLLEQLGHSLKQLLPAVSMFGLNVLLMSGMIALAAVLSCFIDVNRFSLHALYRNRLVRAFLGSARAGQAESGGRQPDPFTGFDPADNRPLASVVPQTPARLFHVINAALNVVRSDNPAWQERKAESFTMTRLFCGNTYVGFRPTACYGGSLAAEVGKKDEGGITLGTAMAISGAAVSPNEGYNSSPLVGFLLMMFNVRLGWWLANPREADCDREGPRSSLGPALRELAGATGDKSRYIYLSDGGHFENLGLYEMVRRRCRMIVISDAGCDPKCTFEDLGNAVRKIYIDFGVSIDFRRLYIRARQNPPSPGVRFALGKIKYPGSDELGWLLYIKPTYLGTERADVRSYASGSSEFPHESTTDQWFSESQLEAYRALGASIVEYICNDGKPLDLGETPRALDLPSLHDKAERLLGQQAVEFGFEKADPEPRLTHSADAGQTDPLFVELERLTVSHTGRGRQT